MIAGDIANMNVPEPDQVNVFMEHLGTILASMVAGILFLMQFTPKKRTATVARAVIKEEPVSMSQLLESQITMHTLIADNFKELRTELLDEIRRLHDRVETKQDKVNGA